MKGVPLENLSLIKQQLSLSVFRGFLNFVLVLSFLTSYFLEVDVISILMISIAILIVHIVLCLLFNYK